LLIRQLKQANQKFKNPAKIKDLVLEELVHMLIKALMEMPMKK
jgi:hypothetical protein